MNTTNIISIYFPSLDIGIYIGGGTYLLIIR